MAELVELCTAAFPGASASLYNSSTYRLAVLVYAMLVYARVHACGWLDVCSRGCMTVACVAEVTAAFAQPYWAVRGAATACVLADVDVLQQHVLLAAGRQLHDVAAAGREVAGG